MYGKPEDDEDLAEFILKDIENRNLINEGISEATNAIQEAVINGIDSAMNIYNK